MRPGFLRLAAAGVLVLAGVGPRPAFAQSSAAGDKMPVTTSSEEARRLYLQGRDLAERLRATDARRFFEQAVAKDQNFALGYVGLANTSGTTKEFIDATTRAVALSGLVSEGERHLILALEAGLKADPAGNLSHLTELVRLHPNDERAHNVLGNLYFGRLDYDNAIDQFVKATTINPSFSQPYNQLGYAYRFLERFGDAENAFKKYTELIPNDPNPYDSYAELLLKMGRFTESIKAYEKALSIDPNFIASYIGIGSNYLAMDQPDQARAAFGRIATVARTTGERRIAHFWTAAAYVHQGATAKAIDELKAQLAVAKEANDPATMSGDLVQMGDVLREAGQLDEAASKYAEAVTVMDGSKVPDEVKAATRRNQIFEEGRLAVEKHDLTTAKAKATEYGRQVAARKAPFEIRQQHELAGRIALAEKRYSDAVQEFGQASQRDPRILYLTAVAWQGAGDAQRAATLAAKAARFNEVNFNFAYVRSKAAKIRGTAHE